MVLRVRLEVVPFGEEEKAYEIGRLDIFNKGRVISSDCAYGVINLSQGHIGLYQDVILHDRPDGAWALVKEAIINLEIEGP